DGKSPRFSLERATSGVNFLHVKLKNGFTYGMLNEFLTGFSDNGALNPGEGIFKGNSDRVIFTVYEYSDTQNGNVVTMESYSDAVEKNPGLAARHPKSAAAPRLMGDGELAYFLAFDTGFILSSVFPGVEDPAQEAFKLLGAVPLFSNDLKAIISSARISIACVTKDKKLNTAYALIETEAPESLNKLYSMISFLGLPRTELQGWDSAFSTSIPNFGLGTQNVVLAHGKGVLLSGIGSAEDFAKSPETPEEYKEFLSQDDIVNGVVSAKLYDALLDMAQNMPSSAPNADSSPNEASIAMITAIRDSLDFAGGKVSASGKGYGKYVSSKDGNRIKALFGVFSHVVQQATGTAASESE
ncbi:MAG: hypothetical protein LBB28_03130, partial [Synergistaceae bacterium]|nr:hypothetical protein [Synergistaceae bacterium]